MVQLAQTVLKEDATLHIRTGIALLGYRVRPPSLFAVVYDLLSVTHADVNNWLSLFPASFP